MLSINDAKNANKISAESTYISLSNFKLSRNHVFYARLDAFQDIVEVMVDGDWWPAKLGQRRRMPFRAEDGTVNYAKRPIFNNLDGGSFVCCLKGKGNLA